MNKQRQYSKPLFLIGIIFCIFFSTINYLALFGEYKIIIFGSEWALVTDPAGWYIPSGIFFFRTKHTLFFGHPGLFLQLIIGTITEVYYLINRLIWEIPYNIFVVKNYPIIIFLISTSIIIINYFSLVVLFKICEKIFQQKTISYIAILCYGTSLPYLISINRIAPDSISILLLLTSLYFLLKFYLESNNKNRRLVYLVISSVAASSICYSKFYVGILSILAIFLYILVTKNDQSLDFSKKKIFFIYLLTSIATCIIWFGKIDIVYFINSWIKIYSERNIPIVITNGRLAFEPSKYEIMLVTEFIFMIISGIGVIDIIKKRSKNNNRYFLLLLLISLFLLPLFSLRFGYHYLLIPIAILSIPFAYLVNLINENYLAIPRKINPLYIGVVFIILVHFTSMVFYSSSVKNCIRAYQRYAQPVYSALIEINYDETIAVKNPKGELAPLFGFNNYTPQPLWDGFSTLFKFNTPEEKIDDPNTRFYIDLEDTGIILKHLPN